MYYRTVYSIPCHIYMYYVLQGGLQYPYLCLYVLCITGRSTVSLVMSVCIMYYRAVYSIFGTIRKYYVLQGVLQYLWYSI